MQPDSPPRQNAATLQNRVEKATKSLPARLCNAKKKARILFGLEIFLYAKSTSGEALDDLDNRQK